ncbi:MAG: LEA type 2 family protein, partial [Bacteroidota bacterium]
LMHKSRLLPLLLLCFVILFGACKVPQAPQVQGFSKFRVNRKNPDRKVQFEVGLDVYNPNRYKLKILDYAVKVYVNDRQIGDATDSEKIVLPRQAGSTVDFGVRTDLKKVLGGVSGMLGGLLRGKTDLDVRVVGTVRARARGITKTVPVDFKKAVSF